jgi:hypothetical protein
MQHSVAVQMTLGEQVSSAFKWRGMCLQMMRAIPSSLDACEAHAIDLSLLRLDNLDQYQHCHGKVAKYVHDVLPGHEDEIATSVRLLRRYCPSFPFLHPGPIVETLLIHAATCITAHR